MPVRLRHMSTSTVRAGVTVCVEVPRECGTLSGGKGECRPRQGRRFHLTSSSLSPPHETHTPPKKQQTNFKSTIEPDDHSVSFPDPGETRKFLSAERLEDIHQRPQKETTGSARRHAAWSWNCVVLGGEKLRGRSQRFKENEKLLSRKLLVPLLRQRALSLSIWDVSEAVYSPPSATLSSCKTREGRGYDTGFTNHVVHTSVRSDATEPSPEYPA